MSRLLLASLALVTLLGCSASTDIKPFASSKGDEKAQLAAYAATAKYPTDMKASTDIKAAALINEKATSVKIANLSDSPLRDVNVWVNGTFVNKINMIPSHGSMSVDRDNFYDTAGQNMGNVNAMINRIEIQSGEHLYLLGTATE